MTMTKVAAAVCEKRRDKRGSNSTAAASINIVLIAWHVAKAAKRMASRNQWRRRGSSAETGGKQQR